MQVKVMFSVLLMVTFVLSNDLRFSAFSRKLRVSFLSEFISKISISFFNVFLQ